MTDTDNTKAPLALIPQIKGVMVDHVYDEDVLTEFCSWAKSRLEAELRMPEERAEEIAAIIAKHTHSGFSGAHGNRIRAARAILQHLARASSRALCKEGIWVANQGYEAMTDNTKALLGRLQEIAEWVETAPNYTYLHGEAIDWAKSRLEAELRMPDLASAAAKMRHAVENKTPAILDHEECTTLLQHLSRPVTPTPTREQIDEA